MRFPRLPNDFSPKAISLGAKQLADLTLRLLDPESSVSDITPGERVYADPDGSFRGRRNGVVFGYTRPHGYAYVLTREGGWLMVNPENLVRKCARWQCEAKATSGPAPHSNNWRYCNKCRKRINASSEHEIVPAQIEGSNGSPQA